MSRIGFGGLVAAVVAVCFGLGWLLSRPPYESMKPTLKAHFTTADEAARNRPPAAGADTAPGWEKRKALRDNVLATADRLDAAPCDAAARKAFFDAYADQAMVMTDDSAQSPDEHGPAFWNTEDDRAVAARVEKLQAARTVTFDEIGHAVMVRRLGAAQVAQMSNARLPQQADRCGNVPTANQN